MNVVSAKFIHWVTESKQPFKIVNNLWVPLPHCYIMDVTNQGIGLRRTDTKPPCYKGNKRRTRPFGFPTGLGPDRPWEINMDTL